MANQSRRILLVASTTGYQTRMFLDAADALKYDVTLATDRCHVLEDPWGDRALPLRFEDPESAAKAVGTLPRVDGIVALGDRPAYVAAVIAERLRLRFHSVESVAICRNKYLTRARFQAAGLRVPKFFRIPIDEDPSCDVQYPCVLKPLGLSASRGVIRANNAGEFAAAFRRVRLLLETPEIRSHQDEQDRFIHLEGFIPGREFALEGIVDNRRLHAIALFDKPDPLDGPLFEETIYVTPSRQDASVQSAIRFTTEQAVHALGLTDGPIHAA